MNRHHYTLIARVIQTSRAKNHTLENFVRKLSAALEATQPNFDGAKFLEQCNPEDHNAA